MRYNFKLNFHYSQPVIRVLSALLLIITNCLVVAPLGYAQGCDDVEFIFARGSGEALGDKNVTAWQDSIRAMLQKSTLHYSFYELGQSTQASYRYPAVSVGDSLGGFGHLLGAYVGRGESFEFGRSVAQGVGELQAHLRVASAVCPGKRFVLGGYSQGAMVLSQTLGTLDSERIIYVATFGDPKLYLPEGKGIIPPACLGESYSGYRANVADCRAYEGVLGSYRPYQPDAYSGKLGTWCNAKDIMCSSGLNTDDHIAYANNGFYAEAARKIKTRLKAMFPNAFPIATINPWAAATHNVAFVIDTSISMVNYLKGYRKTAAALSQTILDQGGKVAVAEFRDLDDPYEPRLLCDFGCDSAAVTDSLSTLTTGGGGDDPESALSALRYTMDQLDWQTGAAKSIILVTDNDYLLPDRDGTILSQVVQRSLEIDPVNIYVLTRTQFQDAYKQLVAPTGGASFNLNDPTEWTKLEDLLLYRPEAMLNAAEFSGAIGEEFTFDASASHASTGGNLRYDWDLDGDGYFEILDGSAIIQQTYASSLSGYISVRVTDNQERFSTMSAKLTVTEYAPSLPEIQQATAEELSSNTYQIHYQTNAERVLVALDDAPLGYLDGSTESFIVSDVTAPTNLRLIPHTSGVGRGESITLAFGRNQPNISPGVTAPVAPSATNNTTSRPAPPVSTSVSSSSPAIIPKAPDAGLPKSHPPATSF